MSAQLRAIQLSLPMQLLRAREAAMAQFRPMLRKHELTEQQWRVIRVLATKSNMDVSDLADRCFLLAPSLSRILQTLEQEGLVKRQADAVDQRRFLISLTTAGRRKFDAVGPDSEALYQSIEARFGKNNLAQLYRLLEQLNDTLSADLSP